MIERFNGLQYGDHACCVRYTKPDEVVEAAKMVLDWVGDKRGFWSIIPLRNDLTESRRGPDGLIQLMRMSRIADALPEGAATRIIEMAEALPAGEQP
jgi:hypothetical protein